MNKEDRYASYIDQLRTLTVAGRFAGQQGDCDPSTIRVQQHVLFDMRLVWMNSLAFRAASILLLKQPPQQHVSPNSV